MASEEGGEEMETLGGAISDVTEALKMRTPVDGSYLPLYVIEAQERLDHMDAAALTKWLAHMVIAAALRDPAMTPLRVITRMLEEMTITDESWREKVGPELRRVLNERRKK